METRLVTVSDLSPSDEQAWRELADRAVEPNPYFEPDFLLLAARHFEGFSKTRLIVAHDGDQFRALLPIVRVGHARVPPRATMTTRGIPTAVCCLCTPLVDPLCPDQAVGALLDELGSGARRRRLPGIVTFDRFDEGGPVAESIRRVAHERRLPTITRDTWTRGTVSRKGRWADPLSRHRRREIGRLTRVLARETGQEPTLLDRTLDPDAVSEFLAMEASGWKGSGHGSAFARDPVKAAWFRAWRDRWVATGRLHVLALNVGSRSIAMQWFVRAGEGLFFFRMAFDADFARYSPGPMLLVSAMEHLLEQTDAEWIDSCADKNNKFVLNMLPEERPLSVVMIGTGGILDRSLVATLPAVTRMAASARRVRDRCARTRRPEQGVPVPPATRVHATEMPPGEGGLPPATLRRYPVVPWC